MAGEKITLDEVAIGEILVVDTDSESGSEASDFENDLEEEEEEEDEHHHHQQQQQQASAEIKIQAATSGVLPTWGPPQGRNTNSSSFCRSSKRCRKK